LSSPRTHSVESWLPDSRLIERLGALIALWPALLGAVVFRSACYALMTALALVGEQRPAPTLPDLVLAHVPYVAWVDGVNYVAWLALFVPLSLLLLWLEPRRWQRYMVTGGIISLLRGLCILLTGLGAPDPLHAGGGLGGASFAQAFVELLSPVDIFGRGAMHAYLTKDLFFSGHTATTFLLVLYLWHRPRLRLLAALVHVVMVAAVLLAHLHYSIDVVGAWAVTYAVFCAREAPWPRARAA
jgi:hypothetical protein